LLPEKEFLPLFHRFSMRPIGFAGKLADQTSFSRNKVKRFVFTDRKINAESQPIVIPTTTPFVLKVVLQRLISWG